MIFVNSLKIALAFGLIIFDVFLTVCFLVQLHSDPPYRYTPKAVSGCHTWIGIVQACQPIVITVKSSSGENWVLSGIEGYLNFQRPVEGVLQNCLH